MTILFGKKIIEKDKKYKNTIFLEFLTEQGGGCLGKFHFLCIEGVKFCLREGDCVLGGQPMGIPSRTHPLAHV